VNLGRGTGRRRDPVLVAREGRSGAPVVSVGDSLAAVDEEVRARDREETKRLLYVAVTRARDELYLCYPRFAPDRGGRDMIQQPSRFIAELCGEGYERVDSEE